MSTLVDIHKMTFLIFASFLFSPEVVRLTDQQNTPHIPVMVQIKLKLEKFNLNNDIGKIFVPLFLEDENYAKKGKL